MPLDGTQTLSSIELPDILFGQDTMLLSDVLAKMQQNKISVFFLLNSEQKLSGIITESDLVKKVGESLEKLNAEASSVMTENPITLSFDNSLKDALIAMSRYQIRHIPVVSEDHKSFKVISVTDIVTLIVNSFEKNISKHGVITNWKDEGNLYIHEDFVTSYDPIEDLAEIVFSAPIREALENRMSILDYNSDLKEVLNLMKDEKLGIVILTEFETKVVGIITERDFLFKVYGKVFDLSLPVKKFMTGSPHLLRPSHRVSHALNNMEKFKYRSNVIVDEDGLPISIITILHLLKHIALGLNIYSSKEDLI